MTRTIVSIISDQTIPNLLFIKEMYKNGDELMFISSKKKEHIINWLCNVFKIDIQSIIRVTFENDDDEERWNVMCKTVESFLSKDKKYLVNLTGGTKYMGLAVQNVFENYDSEFYYIPYPKNYYLSHSRHDNEPTRISERLGVNDYMKAYNISIKNHSILEDKKYTEFFYQKFGCFTESQRSVIDKLRSYREKNIEISNIENKEDDEKYPQICGLDDFIRDIRFPHTGNKLSKYEIKYITGGWFEEYVYHMIKEKISPDDIQIGVEIQKTSTTNINDLDVVFTLGNKLFVVECKTGVGRESLFNQIVYKASSLKEYLFGLSANSYIFSLNPPINNLKSTAKNLGTNYYDLSDFESDENKQKLFNEIINKSFK